MSYSLFGSLSSTGIQGPRGPAGKGISTIVQGTGLSLDITYTDGTSDNVPLSNIFNPNDTIADSLTDDATFTGTVLINGSNSTNKFLIKNNSNVSQFAVDTSSGSTTTTNNTLDDGSGNVGIYGNSFLQGTNSANKLRILDNSSVSIFNVNTSSGSASTKNNTLDDGSGNMTVLGNLSLSKASTPKIVTVSNQGVNIEVSQADGTNNILTLRNIEGSGAFGCALFMYHASGKGIKLNVDTSGNAFFTPGLTSGTGVSFNPGVTTAYDLGSASFIWNNAHINNITMYSGNLTLGTGAVSKTSGNWSMGSGTVAMGGTLTMSGTAGITMTSGTLTLGTGTVTKTSGNWTMGSGTVTGTGTGQFANGIFTAVNAGVLQNKLTLANTGTTAGTGVSMTMSGHNGTSVVTGALNMLSTGLMTTTLPTGGAFAPNTDNAFTCGGASNRWTQVYATTATINTSDQREKNTILDSDLGLNFINELRPVSYKFNVKQNNPVYDSDNQVVSIVPEPGVRKHYGLIAQEVKSVMDNLNITTNNFAGYIYDTDNDKYGLRYEEFICPIIKSIQELSAKIDVINTHLGI